MPRTDDLRIREMKELTPPAHLIREFPVGPEAEQTASQARVALHRILHGQDDRLMVVIGPCSIHEPKAALEYARRLAEQRRRFAGELEIVMRVYFEKPRTTVGWKGMINDPYMDNSFRINDGLRMARELLRDINELGLPAGTEFLDVISPQYIADLISWGAIGARTTESQVHRELASGLSCPVGFKNGTDGNIKIAADAIKAASQPHHFLSVTKGGHSAIVSTAGNEDCHIILRGGKTPNYDAASVDDAVQAAGRQRPGQPPDDRRLPRQQQQESAEPGAGVRRHRPPGRRRRRPHRRGDGGIAPGGRAPGPGAGEGADVRAVGDGWVHRLGDQHRGAGGSGGECAQARLREDA
jgi:3-deoxy-7-phosphoheptulonate synthase